LRSQINSIAGGRLVKIVAVTKTFPAEAMSAAYVAECDAVGENYAQELINKVSLVSPAELLPVHFIGHVQLNKVKRLMAVVDVWQTIDRPLLIETLATATDKGGIQGISRRSEVFIQVNATSETQKSGCALNEVEGLVALAARRGLSVVGLMTIGPSSGDAAETRRAFRSVAKLQNELGLAECSMGMSGDFQIAIEEGSTMVRIGSRLFGERPRSG